MEAVIGCRTREGAVFKFAPKYLVAYIYALSLSKKYPGSYLLAHAAISFPCGPPQRFANGSRLAYVALAVLFEPQHMERYS